MERSKVKEDTGKDKMDVQGNMGGEWDMGWKAAPDMSTNGHPRTKETVGLRSTGGWHHPSEPCTASPHCHSASEKLLSI